MIINTPAALLVDLAIKYEIIPNKDFTWSNSSGPWHNSIFADGTITDIPYDSLGWDLLLANLFIGQLAFELDLAKNESELTSQWTINIFKTIKIKNTKGQISFTDIETLLEKFGINFNGAMLIDLNELTLKDGLLTGLTGKINLRNFEINGIINLNLDNIEISATTVDQEITIAINDIGGDLEINGNIIIDKDGQYESLITLKGQTPATIAQIKNMAMFGKKTGGGTLLLSGQGKTPLLPFF